MTSRATKARRRAAPSISGAEAIALGLLPEFYWLHDPVDDKFAQLTKGNRRRPESDSDRPLPEKPRG
jgi:hypothetical protein